MRLSLVWIAMTFLFAEPALSNTWRVEHRYETSRESLTTERVWELWPEEQNPHRRRWVLEQRLELLSLKAVSRKEARSFGVRADGITSLARGWLRSDPAYYVGKESCVAPERSDVHATLDGTKESLNRAAQNWAEYLKARSKGLLTVLGKIRAERSELAMARAQAVFQEWSSQIRREWRREGVQKMESLQRREDHKRFLKACKGQKGSQVAAGKSWESILAEAQSLDQSRSQRVAISPAKRFEGSFTIRLSIDVLGRRLNGRFLIDPSREENLVSPDFVRAQGANPEVAQDRTVLPRRVRRGGRVVALKPMLRDRVELSGFELRDVRFWFGRTESYSTPRNRSGCCDGVLGRDFLRRFAVEFIPRRGSEIHWWTRAGFEKGSGWSWLEVSATVRGIESLCEMQESPEKRKEKRKEKGKGQIGVLWDLMQAGVGEKASGSRMDLLCGGATILSGAQVGVGGSRLSKKTGRFRAGMSLLSRGKFALDLANGKLWMEDVGLSRPLPKNQSGLGLRFGFEKGDRVLRVTQVSSRGPTADVFERGLRKGALIEELDGRGVGDLSAWEVDQILAGRRSREIAIVWKRRDRKLRGVVRLAP